MDAVFRRSQVDFLIDDRSNPRDKPLEMHIESLVAYSSGEGGLRAAKSGSPEFLQVV
jgi:hypothetical protein